MNIVEMLSVCVQVLNLINTFKAKGGTAGAAESDNLLTSIVNLVTPVVGAAQEGKLSCDTSNPDGNGAIQTSPTTTSQSQGFTASPQLLELLQQGEIVDVLIAIECGSVSFGCLCDNDTMQIAELLISRFSVRERMMMLRASCGCQTKPHVNPVLPDVQPTPTPVPVPNPEPAAHCDSNRALPAKGSFTTIL